MKYYVIEFGQPPTEDYDKYVCVPQSWVVEHDNNKIVFRYPKEKVPVTKKRISRGENVSEEWPIYLETVSYKSESLHDAKDFAKILMKRYRKTHVSKKSLPIGATHEKHIDQTHRPAIYKGSKVHEDVNDSTATNATLNSKEVHTLCSNLQALVNEMKRQNDFIEKLSTDFEEIRNVSLSNAASLKKMESKISMIETDRVNKTPRSVRFSVQETQTWREDEVTAKRKCIRSVSLPPEYDENDSRWTLRYYEMAPELEELRPGTGVYVNSKRFANCKRMANNEVEMARLLLMEVFSKNALQVCSFTGGKPVRHSLNETPIRPGLDEHARNVLLDFLEEYCREKRWDHYYDSTRRGLKRALVYKLQAIHLKYKKTNLD